jgi:hypothetical protein
VPERLGLAGVPVEHLVSAGDAPGRLAEGPVDQLPYGTPSHAELGGVQPVDRLHESIDAAIAERAEVDVARYSARTLCRACVRFLARLDARAIPLLEPMIDGAARSYTVDEQRLLAAWGARAAYAVLAVERKAQGVPKTHRLALRESSEPHGSVFVGYGRYRSNHVGVLAARLLTPIEERGEGVEAYSVLGIFGHMTLKVFGVRRRPPGVRVKPPEGQMVRVWPAQEEHASWPPLWGLTENTLEQAFLFEPFYRPFRYSEVRYLGPGKKVKVKRKRTEGLGPHR